jgi:hypothetical protein
MPLDLPDWAAEEWLEAMIADLEDRIVAKVHSITFKGMTEEINAMIRERGTLAAILREPSRS